MQSNSSNNNASQKSENVKLSSQNNMQQIDIIFLFWKKIKLIIEIHKKDIGGK